MRKNTTLFVGVYMLTLLRRLIGQRLFTVVPVATVMPVCASRKHPDYTRGNRHCSDYCHCLLFPCASSDFHRHHSGQPALLNRHYNGDLCGGIVFLVVVLGLPPWYSGRCNKRGYDDSAHKGLPHHKHAAESRATAPCRPGVPRRTGVRVRTRHRVVLVWDEVQDRKLSTNHRQGRCCHARPAFRGEQISWGCQFDYQA